MIVTNRQGLPEAIVEAVKNDGYSRGAADISVTGLLKPPRLSALEALNAPAITEDASDRIWSLVGQVMHGILERANKSGIAERRLSIKVRGWIVSGSMDLYHEAGLLQDYKFVTAWKFKDGGIPIEYEQQLNCYAEILRQNGESVERAEIVAILRDWSKREAMRNEGYPQAQVIRRPARLWAPEEAQAFMDERVRLHQQAREILPECSAEERWQDPTTYAVMKKGAKRALKIYESGADAYAHAGQDAANLSVEVRRGEPVRCMSYCSVAKFCRQYQDEINFEGVKV